MWLKDGGSGPCLCHRFAAWLLACHLISLCSCTCNQERECLVHFKSSYPLSKRSKLFDSPFAQRFCTHIIFAVIRITFAEAWPCLYTCQPPCHCCCCMSVSEILLVGMFWHWMAGTFLHLPTCHIAARLIQRWLLAGQDCQPICEQSWGCI